MAKRSILLLLVVAILVGLSQSADAYLGRSINLVKDAAQADVVLVGELQGTPSHGPADEDGEMDISWAFHVDRVLKGDLTPGSTITIKYRGRLAVINGPINTWPGTRLMMLKRVGENYDFAFRSENSVPTSKVARTPYTQSSDVRDNLRWEVINSLSDRDRPVLLSQARYVLSPEDITRYVKPLAQRDDAATRAAAVEACLSIGDQSVVTPTLRYIEERLKKEGNARSSQNGMSFLATSLRGAKVTTDNLQMFLEALGSENTHVRDTATWALGDSKLKEALPYLETIIKESDNAILRNRAMKARNHLLRGLQQEAYAAGKTKGALLLGGSPSLPAATTGDVISTLDDSCVFCRVAAAKELGMRKGAGVIEPLKHALTDEFGVVRAAAAEALLQLGDESGLPVLRQLLLTEPTSGQLKAAGLLARAGDDSGLSIAEKQLTSRRFTRRMAAVSAMGASTNDDIAYRALETGLKDESEYVRVTAINLLGERPAKRSIDLLSQQLSHPDKHTRRIAVRALGRIYLPETIPALIDALANDDGLVRSSAGSSLNRLTGQQMPVPSSIAGDAKDIEARWRSWWEANKYNVKLQPEPEENPSGIQL